ncbi:MAG: hypothetical protein GWN00_07965 [Aliifodinibius sp.]|nr:hypothetical protein [Fodinibius sp.]NIV11154.1 hypothetical protein [Fodinibius sp.]NIY24744.1 hypothetical protein [Fodinibius sp.]
MTNYGTIIRNVFANLHNYNYPQQDSSTGLYSYDDGATWLDLNVNGLGSRVNSINFYSGDIFVGTDSSGVFFSSDFGGNWVNANLGLSDEKIKGMIVHRDGFLFCGTENEGIFIADLNPLNINDINSASGTFSLYQNYPNPFNSTTIINYAIHRESHVILEVYNLLAKKLRIWSMK